MEELNDYELVSLAQEQNEDACYMLHEKYLPLIRKKSLKYLKYLKNKGLELSDLIQECTIILEEAISKFNSNEDGTFYTYINTCMDNKLMNEIRKQNRIKYKALNEAIPLEDDDENSLIDFIGDDSTNPELDILSNENFKELYLNIIKELTDLEECVFKLKVQGFTYKEISDILDKDDKSIDNTIQRIKIKIKSLIEKNT